MKKVLVIEKDLNTLNALSMFIASLQMETLNTHSWPPQVKNIEFEEIGIVIVNVELPSVQIDKLFESFKSDKANSVPIIYLYSRTFDPKYVKSKEFPFDGDSKKPLDLSEIYKLMENYIPMESLPVKGSNFHVQLKEYRELFDEHASWQGRLKGVLDK